MNIQNTRQLTDELSNLLTRELFFIIGLPKSGTTWVQHILNAHSEIICRGESHFFDILLPLLQRCFQYYNKEILKQGGIVAHLKEYGGHVESLNYKMEDVHLVLLYCIHRMLQKWNTTGEDNLVLGEKTPDTIHHLNLLNSLLPHSKVIHVIRDGRDCATSGWFFNISGMKDDKTVNQSFDQYAFRFVNHWRDSVRLARNIGSTMNNRYLEVRYETLLTQPEVETTRMARFLGVSANAEYIENCINHGRFENMGDGRPRGQELKTAFVRKGISGDWKNHFSSELSRRVWDSTGDLLHSLGYPAP